MEQQSYFIPLIIIALLIALIMTVAYWKIFSKSGYPGWKCLIPVYNLIIFLKITGNKTWWIFILLVPLVNLVVAIILLLDLGKVFGKRNAFRAGLIFLPFIFIPILGFSKASYSKPEDQPVNQ